MSQCELKEAQRRPKKKVWQNICCQPPLETEKPYLGTKFELHIAEMKLKQINAELVNKKICVMRENVELYWELKNLENYKDQLKNLFKNSDKKIQEKNAYRSRFYEIIREDVNANKKIVSDTIKTITELEDYKNVKEKMEKSVEEYSVYKNFLEALVAETNEFNSVGDILNKYNTLKLMAENCKKTLIKEMNSSTDQREEFSAVVKEKLLMLKSLNNKLIQLNVQHKQAKDRRIHLEKIIDQLRNKIIFERNEDNELRNGAWDLYSQMCRRLNIPPTIHQHNMSSLVDFIKKTIEYFNDVSNIGSHLKTTKIIETRKSSTTVKPTSFKPLQLNIKTKRTVEFKCK